MLKTALAAASILALLTVQPRAEGQCISIDMAMSEAQSRGYTVEFFAGNEIGRAVELYNLLPPPSNEQWTVAGYVLRPDGSGVLILGEGTAICTSVNLPPHYMRAALRTIRGEGV